jgi:hypothetical protein
MQGGSPTYLPIIGRTKSSEAPNQYTARASGGRGASGREVFVSVQARGPSWNVCHHTDRHSSA